MNNTLGFERIYALVLPGRADRTRPLLNAAKATNLNLTVLDAIRDKDIAKEFWPQDWKDDHTTGELGCLVSHVRTWNKMIAQNVSSALIVESDADWDLRLRSSMRKLALGVRTLIDWPFEQPHNAQPYHVQPYGDSWDIIWTGHCGSSHEGNTRIYRWNDSSVPPRSKTWVYKPVLTDEQHIFGTRSLFQFGSTTCTTSYAISLQGAVKLVNYFKKTNKGLDETMSRVCTTKVDLTCVSVWPQVMMAADTKSNILHHKGQDIVEGGEIEFKPMDVKPGPSIQYSAWRNARRIIDEGAGRDKWLPEWYGTWVNRNGKLVFDNTETELNWEE
ncbi:hypothetical protein ACLMJK_001943 [Lecanora helva]